MNGIIIFTIICFAIAGTLWIGSVIHDLLQSPEKDREHRESLGYLPLDDE